MAPGCASGLSGHVESGAAAAATDADEPHRHPQLPRRAADDASAGVRAVRFQAARGITSPERGGRIEEILAQVRREVAIVPVPEWNRFPHSFGHVFAGGYAAGYYSYKWAEVLAADAFEAFEEKWCLRSDVRAAISRTILSRGGSRDPLDAFVEFRGREPDVGAFLRQHGIAPARGRWHEPRGLAARCSLPCCASQARAEASLFASIPMFEVQPSWKWVIGASLVALVVGLRDRLAHARSPHPQEVRRTENLLTFDIWEDRIQRASPPLRNLSVAAKLCCASLARLRPPA